MKSRSRNALVLGGNGFIGWNACLKLLDAGWKVTAFDKSWDLRRSVSLADEESLKVVEGSVFDKAALRSAMDAANVVFHFISFTVPITMPRHMQTEIQTTLPALENVLATMAELEIPKIVFPSSGGTIYGQVGQRAARETDELKPLSSYGMGKWLAEQMIRFYHRVHDIEYSILRIANAYGAERLERISQGLIDVFLEKHLAGEELVLWGDENQVRDYIFIDDVMDAMLGLMDQDEPISTIVNVGSGSGASIGEVLSIMKKVVGHSMQWKVKGEQYAGIPYNVLDISMLHDMIGWKPRYSLEAGIEETWRRKMFKR